MSCPEEDEDPDGEELADTHDEVEDRTQSEIKLP